MPESKSLSEMAKELQKGDEKTDIATDTPLDAPSVDFSTQAGEDFDKDVKELENAKDDYEDVVPESERVVFESPLGPERIVDLAALEWAHVLDFLGQSRQKEKLFMDERATKFIRELEDSILQLHPAQPGWYKDKRLAMPINSAFLPELNATIKKSKLDIKKVHGVAAFIEQVEQA